MTTPQVELSTMRCIIDGRLIPALRIRRNRSCTCSEECHKEYLVRLKDVMSVKDCPRCHRPSTPGQRAAFRRFRYAEQELPDILYPRLFKAFRKDHPEATPQEFLAHLDNDETVLSVQKDVREMKEGLKENRENIISVISGGIPTDAKNANLGPIQPIVQDLGNEHDATDSADSV